MRKFLILATCALPLTLAACAEVGIQKEETVVGAPADGTVVIPADGSEGSETLVVRPTRLVSTNLGALAGTYDRDVLACGHAASPDRVIVADDGLTLEGRKWDLRGLERTGSALKVTLDRVDGMTRTERIAYVTPAAQGIQLRSDTTGDRDLIRCER